MSAPDFKLRTTAERNLAAVSGGNLLRTSCHHRRNGACGACYARLTVLIDAITTEPSRAVEFVTALQTAMQAECLPDQRKAMRAITYGGPVMCPHSCSECNPDACDSPDLSEHDRFVAKHHFGDFVETAAEEPDHDAAKAGHEAWFTCKHCDAWCLQPDGTDDR